jgi:ribonuclease VapC
VIALDSSAIVAIAVREPEADSFLDVIGARSAVIGAPTLVETHLVLSRKAPGVFGDFLRGFVIPPHVRVIDFTAEMYHLATDAFDRYGKGRGHRAQLNFGDCLAYAVAKAKDVPLLYKGADFAHTDIRPALP